MTEPQLPINTSFSEILPGLQYAVDSTSLGAYKTCPRLYYYSIIQGWQPRFESVHLTFGILMHKGREFYDHAKAEGQGHEDALAHTIHQLLLLTWNKELKRPWDSGDPNKNRLTLVRTLVWYLDKYGDNDALETVILASGKPAVELSFRFDFGYRFKSTGERAIACGHLDRLAKLNDEYYIPDIKTSKYTIDASYFAGYSPDNQFSMYTLAGKIAFAMPVKGVILDAIQILVTGSRFQRGLIPRSQDQVDEFVEDSHQVLFEMETSALNQHWRMNDKSCHNIHGRPCDFRSVCSRPKGAREQWLKTEFRQRVWDPLQRRGDI